MSPIGLDPEGPLLVAINPLDASSNIGANVTIGTVFSVLDAPAGSLDPDHFLQRGTAPARRRHDRLRPPCRLRLHGRLAASRSRPSIPETETYRIVDASRGNPSEIQRVRDQLRRIPAIGRAPVQAYVEDSSKVRKVRANAISTCAGSAPWSPTSTGS